MAALGIRFITLLLVCGALHCAVATVYNVGRDAGWTFHAGNSSFYDDEFTGVTLLLGDALNFTFTEGEHNVQAVTAVELASCESDPSSVIYTISTIITLNITGNNSFICTFPDHCAEFGMHLTVTVGTAGAPTSLP